MKKVFILILLGGIFLSAGSLTVVFHEDFEAPSLGDSVNCGFGWGLNDSITSLGSNSISCQVQTGLSVYVMTYPYLILCHRLSLHQVVRIG